MKKILSLVLAIMFCVAIAASAELAGPSIRVEDITNFADTEIAAVEGATYVDAYVNIEAEIEAYKSNPEQYLGRVAAAVVKDLPMIGVKKGALVIAQDTNAVKMTAKAPAGLKDGDKVAVAICIPGWDGDAIQGEIVDGKLVFELDEQMLIALRNLPGFNEGTIELLFAFFKGEIQA